MIPTPLIYPVQEINIPRTNSRPTYTTVTASGTAHTKGSWVELIASTSGPGYWIKLRWAATTVAATDTSMLLDLGIGAATSEQVIIADIGAGFSQLTTAGQAATARNLEIPFFIPSGSRVAARCQGAVTSDEVEVYIDILGGGYRNVGRPYFTACDTFGANAGTSSGVQLTTGNANVKGAWSQIVASTTNDIDALMVSIQGDDTMLVRDFLFDVGIGAATSEVVVVTDHYASFSSAERITYHDEMLIPLGVRIPAGTRIAMRNQTTSNGATDAFVHLHGLRY